MAKPYTCTLVTLGDELLMGLRANTHLEYFGHFCAEQGIRLVCNITTTDTLEEIEKTIKYALKCSDIIIVTGGLGPTQDDNTREGVSRALDIPLFESPKARNMLSQRLNMQGRTITDASKRQCLSLTGSTLLENHYGTAPGQYLEYQGKTIILLPGPPSELQPMFEQYAVPLLQNAQMLKPSVPYLQIKIAGLPEVDVADQIEPLKSQFEGLEIGYCAHAGQIDVRFSGPQKDQAVIEARSKLNEFIFAEGNLSLEASIIQKLIKTKQSLATAESCTGGLLGDRLTNIAGASNAFKGGIICYHDEIKKEYLGVSQEILQHHSAVSEICAKAMAEGISKKMNSSIGVSITGYTGPNGGTEKDPVGSVYIGIHNSKNSHVERIYYPHTRQIIKEYAVSRALLLIWKGIKTL